MTHVAHHLQTSGYAVVPDLLTPAEADRLAAKLDTIQQSASEPNVRNLLRVPIVRALADDTRVRAIVDAILGPTARPVRGILFDKTPGANWNVLWHQDLSIAVKERREVAGYGPWSVKEGVVHVQPPRGVLERMVTVRVNLDDCGEDNGPLRVIPGSHAEGVLSGEQVEARKRRGGAVSCTGPKGATVVMRPLILHASGKARAPGRRRVVHIEYAVGELHGGLEWFEC